MLIKDSERVERTQRTDRVLQQQQRTADEAKW
jgi:hypothetical protein